MENNLIQWPRAKYWTKAFNPVVGCEKISEGCQNCYAERVTAKFGINGGNFAPKIMHNAKPPKSGVVFVGNMTDIFGEWVENYDLVTYLTSLSTSAVNLVLTKRSKRFENFNASSSDHVWYGVTCENQQRADERIPHLLSMRNTNNRWLSLEPLLGPINLAYPCFTDGCNHGSELHIDWVVVGAESGPNRRECKIEWIESIVNQCLAAGVPVFVKQIHIDGKLVDDINKFPEHLRIRQIPWQAVSK